MKRPTIHEQADFGVTSTPRLAPLRHTAPAANDDAVRRVLQGNAFHAECAADRLVRRRSRSRRFFRALLAFLLGASPWGTPR
jgi:hypothetical protein